MRSSVTALTILLAVSVAATPAIAGRRVTAAGVTLEPPTGEPATDLSVWFDDAWRSVTSAHSNVQASAAESTPTSTGLDGRAVAGVMNDGSGGAHILVLAAVSDGKRLAPMLIEFATQDSLTRLGDLAPASDSIKLVANSAKPKKAFARGGWRYPISGTAAPALVSTPTTPPPVQHPSTPAAPTAPPPAPAAGTKNLPFLGKWSVGQSAYSASYSMSYGSRLLQYDFAADGTYRYHSEAWGGTFNSNWRYIVDEKGAWTASGDQLTLSPKEVVGVVRDLAGKVQKNGGPALEKVTYRFATTYFSGLQETQLVLTPPKATNRDGAFASNPSFPRSYLMRSGASYQPAFRFAPN